MPKEHKYQGETFLLDDSKGCYIEVNYDGLVGYVGVHLNGTEESPYCWETNDRRVTDDGLTNGNSNGKELSDNLNDLCSELLRQHQEREAKKEFQPEQACKLLHEFYQKLPA